MAPNLTLRRLESVPLGVIYARRREAIGSGLSCRRRSPRPDQVKFEACIPDRQVSPLCPPTRAKP
jgi:hypothetical protein